ncbi:hypothetical protein [Dictyobacter kobayashii]|uniref:Uncharacterized protein n=1 Tax=Dictyobacter kobayashii TaxID=2014872 RepID=A0A402ACE9_9CHLR|nr:hypothetical protein [Dictyobacter kobayashii]GCE16758.1 hypothetical protein KDK_05580 [Dictyobacter kobayashii]
MKEEQTNEYITWLTEAKQRHHQIESVVFALYEEVDKLSRKWPTMPITQLTLNKTNKVIKSFKDLLKNEDDDFAEDINEIIPAGDLPEMRDLVLILSQVRAALGRFENKYQNEWRKLDRNEYYV